MKAVLFIAFTAAGALLILPYLGVDVWGTAAQYFSSSSQEAYPVKESAPRDRTTERPRAVASGDSGKAKDSTTLDEIESLLD